MKYFTMEELDYIARELMENPSKETLKRLNDKYNGDEQITNNLNWVEVQQKEVEPKELTISNNDNLKSTNIAQGTDNNSIPNLSIPIYENPNAMKTEEIISNDNNTNSSQFNEELSVKVPVWEPINNTNNMLFDASVKSVQEREGETTGQLNPSNPSSSTLLTPNLNIQESSQNNNIPNLEMPKLETIQSNNNPVEFNGNLWEPQNTMMNNMMQTTDNFNAAMTNNNATSMEEIPFFQPNLNTVNNPMPVNEPPKVEGPTMFGQFEQNFNNNAA